MFALTLSMESLLLPLALLAGSAAAESPQNTRARGQATVSARIIRGESIRFGKFSRPPEKDLENRDGIGYILPLARSNGTALQSDSAELRLVEFY